MNRQCTLRYDEESGYMISFNGGVFQLNEISAEIILELEKGKKSSEIVSELARKYSVAVEEVEEDVKEFLNYLRKIDLYK